MSRKQQFTGLMLVVILVLLLASSATLYADSGWDAKYWNNTTLSGDPVLQRNESKLDHNWGDDRPHATVNESNFSARWKRTANFTAGTYRFTATMDDGMRVWVDDVLIIDSWWDSQEHSISADVYLSNGDHEVKVKYYDAGGEAVAKLDWVWVSSSSDTAQNWHGEYYNNITLSGSPAMTRNDLQINFDWGGGAPTGGAISADQFSVRWTRDLNLNAGRYRFTTTADDGVRLWVNNVLIIDRWFNQEAAPHPADITLPGGNVPVKMEYYENGGGAIARLSWTQISTSTPPPNTNGAYTAVVNVHRLNMRQGPGTGYGIVTTVNRNTAVTLTQRNADTSWVRVILPNGTQGWMSARYLGSPSRPFASLPVGSTPAPVTPPPPTNNTTTAAVIHAYHLNVRSGPGTNNNVVAVINIGQVVTLTGETNSNGTWVKIILANGVQGWVNAYYLG